MPDQGRALGGPLKDTLGANRCPAGSDLLGIEPARQQLPDVFDGCGNSQPNRVARLFSLRKTPGNPGRQAIARAAAWLKMNPRHDAAIALAANSKYSKTWITGGNGSSLRTMRVTAMRDHRSACFAACLFVCWLCGPLALEARAQFMNNGGLQNNQPLFNNNLGGQMPAGNQMTQQQLQSMMMMRAMQMGGRHQVRTGFPQMIPLGNGTMVGGQMMGNGMMGGQMPYVDDSSTSRKSSSSKRAEARKLRDEEKRAAREEAKLKKPKAEKAEKADKKPADKTAADKKLADKKLADKKAAIAKAKADGNSKSLDE